MVYKEPHIAGGSKGILYPYEKYNKKECFLEKYVLLQPQTYIRYQAILRINAKHIMSCHGKIPLPVPCTHIIAIDSLHTIFPIAYILCLISHIPYDRIFISTLSPIHIQIHQFPCAFPSSPSVSGFISAKSIRCGMDIFCR